MFHWIIRDQIKLHSISVNLPTTKLNIAAFNQSYFEITVTWCIMIYLNHVKLVIILDLIVFRSNLGGKMETKKTQTFETGLN